ncbi:MAG TPA: hypothetical protein VF970_05120 [Gemmatimonadales bacterium]
MNQPGARSPAERAYGVVHTGLVAGVVIFGLLAVLLAQRSAPPLVGLRLPLRVAGLLELAFLIVAGTLVRRTVVPPARGADRHAWWMTTGPRVILLWALAEGTALLGCVFWYLSRDPVLFAALTGVGLAVLVWSGPGRMTE